MEILPSYLKEKDRLDFCLAKIKEANKSLEEKKKIREIHIDVMDRDFVDGEGVDILDARKVVKEGFFADIHVMARNAEKYIEEVLDVENKCVTVHVELEDVEDILKKYYGAFPLGLAINPETDITDVIPYLKYITRILVMSVTPGKGGQSFIKETTSKIAALKEILKKENKNICIVVDGGINKNTISSVDVNKAVVGSYITDNLDNLVEILTSLNN